MPEALKKAVNSDTSFYQRLINFGEKMCKKHKTKKYLNYFVMRCALHGLVDIDLPSGDCNPDICSIQGELVCDEYAYVTASIKTSC